MSSFEGTLDPMWLGGDPEAIRHSAARLRALTDTLALDRDRAAGRLRAVQWESAAAEAFRAQSTDDFALYDHASAELEEAARVLEELASTLADRQQALTSFAAEAGRTLEEIWSAGVSGAGNLLHDISGGLL